MQPLAPQRSNAKERRYGKESCEEEDREEGREEKGCEEEEVARLFPAPPPGGADFRRRRSDVFGRRLTFAARRLQPASQLAAKFVEPQPGADYGGRRMERPAYYPLAKFAIEAGPLLAFFIANSRADIFVGTGVFMAATIVSVIAAYLLDRKLPMMPLVTGVFVLVFGGLTLWLHNDLFIKLKPT
ncbi:MAG TPA: septation protein IspZ, partial [Candidatus Sulfotelmatobacter sp.]|nr:septation protein IspZ [Candidatus Sulfotelmatobacter sp.]